MFVSWKLLFVLIYFVFEQNEARGSPAGEPSDGDDPPGPPVDDKWKMNLKQVDADRLKLSGNTVQQDSDEPATKKEDETTTGDKKEEPKDDENKQEKPEDDGSSDIDDKKSDKNDDNKKKDDGNNDSGKEEDGTKVKRLKEKEKLTFAIEDETASLNWPLGIVHYYLDSSVFDFIVAYNLRKAMDLIESVSCIQFKTMMLMPSQNMTWINITNPNKVRECVHEREEGKPGEIVMVLGFDCMKQKQILHTLLHAIGFKDEVTHPLRDQYVHVIWDNIQAKYLHLFRSQPNEVAARTMYEYDPASIMHFHDRAYSKNGQATIQPLLPGLQIGPTDTLSALDKLKLRTLFDRECNKRKVIGLQESCKNVISKKLKSPEDETAEKLKFEVKNTNKSKGNKSKKRSTTLTPSMEEKERKREMLLQEDAPRTSEGN